MSVVHPESLVDWRQHIAQIAPQHLRSRAIAANSFAFVQILLSEGLEPVDIEDIFTSLANRLVESAIDLPSGGYFDLHRLRREAALLRPRVF